MSTAIVSVIMPVFNSELYLEASVLSMLNQTYTHFELICIDDCSTDNSLALLQQFSDPRIKIIRQKNNGGVAHARNTGIQAAKGEYIAFLDSDDIAYPDRLEKQLTYLQEHKEADVVFGRVRLIDVYGNPNGRWLDDEQKITPEDISSSIAIANCVSQPAAMLRRAAISSAPYNTSYRDSEDWGLWLQLLSEGKSLHKIDEVLVDYRIRPSSETQRSNAKPLEKIIRFRETFLSLQNERNIFTEIEKTVAIQLERDRSALLFESKFKHPFRVVKKVIKARPMLLLVHFFQLHFFLKQQKSTSIYFFFPFFHIGGAEKVHAAIVQCFEKEKSLVFFTKKSENTGFLSSFTQHAKWRDIGQLAWYPFFKKIAAKRIASHINNQSSPVLVSSNSIFFYELLPYLKPHVRCIDLIHAFVHPEESGPEKWSLPFVHQLNARVFIGQKAIDDLKNIYQKNQLSADLLDRVRLIRNYITLPDTSKLTPIEGSAQLIYIGRSTPEKRVHLAAKIAQGYMSNGSSKKITMVGDIANGLAPELHSYCDFKGIISDESEVYRLLQSSDILLLTSSREGFPMAIAEAMANGVIPISTGVGDIPNVLRHGENGFLLSSANEEKIIEEALSFIKELEQNPELTLRIRQQARKDAERLFAKSTFVERWKDVVLGK